MSELTKTKARELIKRELGISGGKMTLLKDEGKVILYIMQVGNAEITLKKWDNKPVIRMTLKLSSSESALIAHYFSDTLEPFIEYNTFFYLSDQDLLLRQRRKETIEAKEAVKYALRRHFFRRCRVCGCTDDHACPGGCY
ncbi:MAG: hypothetical protein RSF82_03715 [Angelakisella sp.]